MLKRCKRACPALAEADGEQEVAGSELDGSGRNLEVAFRGAGNDAGDDEQKRRVGEACAQQAYVQRLKFKRI